MKPNVLARAKLALRVFRRGMPGVPWVSQAKASGQVFLWPEFLKGKPYKWRWGSFRSFVEEGFNLNSLIYSAIMYKARAQMAAPLRAYIGDRENPEPLAENRSLARIVARPNAYQSWSEFQAVNTVYLNVDGNCYVRKVDWDKPDKRCLYSLRPDRVYHIPDPGSSGSVGFLYVPQGKAPRDGIRIVPSEMIHIRLPNPLDPFEGMGPGLSPMASLALPGDVDNMVTKFLKVFFESGTMLAGTLTFDYEITPEEAVEAREKWKEFYGGWQNWDEIGVFGKGGKFQRMMPSFEEMGFDAIDERNETRILGPFGVPPILIGSRIGLARSTYSNVQEARRQFWEDTFKPELMMFEDSYRQHLRDGEAFVAFDFSEVPALQRNIPALVEAAHKLWSMGAPAHRAFATMKLDVGEIPGGDLSYVPVSMIPVGEAPPRQIEAGEEGEEGAKALLPFRGAKRLVGGAEAVDLEDDRSNGDELGEAVRAGSRKPV